MSTGLPHLTGPQDTCYGGGTFPFSEMQSVYSTAPSDWATGHSLQDTRWGWDLPLFRDAVGVFYCPIRLGYRTLVVGVGLTPFQRCSRCILLYSTAPSDWATGHSLWGWDLGLTPFQRCSRRILCPIRVFYCPTAPIRLGYTRCGGGDTHCGGGTFPFSEMQSVYSTAPSDWATGHSLWAWDLPLFRDAVGVFYSPRQLSQNIALYN